MFAAIIDGPRREERKVVLPTLSVCADFMNGDLVLDNLRGHASWDIETIKPLNNTEPLG